MAEKPPKRLTARQREVLRFIIDFAANHDGCGPMIRHIAQKTGARPGQAILLLLEKRGYLRHPYDGGPWQPVRDENDQFLSTNTNNTPATDREDKETRP